MTVQSSPDRSVIIVNKDRLMNHGRDQLVLALTNPGSIAKPTHIAVGLERHAGGNLTTLTELEQEVERVAIESWDEEPTRARLLGSFTAKIGAGDWLEAGLFDAAANEAMLSNCDTVGSWTSQNAGYPQPDPSEAKEGAASLESVGEYSLPTFRNIGGLDSYSGTNYTTNARFQLWYYIDDKSKIDGGVRVYLGSDPENDPPGNDSYYWDFVVGDLVDGWNFLSRKFSECSGQSGSPDLDSICSCYIDTNKTESALERIDKLRLFEEAGNMWARAEFENAVEKQWGEVRAVYWYVKFTIE